MAAVPQSGGRVWRAEPVGGSEDTGTRPLRLISVADSATALEEADYRHIASTVQDRPVFVPRQRVQPLDLIFFDYTLPWGDSDGRLRLRMDRSIWKPFHPAKLLDGCRSTAPHTDNRSAGYQHA